MAKNEKRTLNVILDDLNNAVNSYNDLDIADAARLDLTKQAKELTKEYNELSMLTAYSTCMQDKLPIKAFVEAFNYKTVSTKDTPHYEVDAETGSKSLVFTRSVTEGTSGLNLVKFLEWAAEKNVQVAASKDWRIKMAEAKDAIKDAWKKFQASRGDTHKVSIKALKKSMQGMFDALIFIPTEKGENSVFATGNIAKTAFQFANQANTKAEKNLIMGDVLPDRVWNAILMKSLLAAVSGKQLIINFDGEAAEEEAAETPAAEAEAK